MKKEHLQDVAVGGGIVAAGLLGVFVLIPLGIVTPDGVEIAALAPDFWPNIVMSGLVLCGAIILVQGLVNLRNTSPDAADTDKAEDELEDLPAPQLWMRVAAVLVTFFVYYFSVHLIGIVVASVAAIVVLTLLGGERRWWMIAAIALLLPIALYYFFTAVANVPLPLGVFETWR